MRHLETREGVLHPVTSPTPSPGPGELLVEVAASGVNRADLLQVAGHYPSPPGAPDFPGLEVAGRVVAIGPPAPADPDLDAAARAWHVGDRAAALLPGGGYASHAVVRADHAFPIPAAVTDVAAAALPEALCTVWSSLVGVGEHRAGDLVEGESLLVLGASGGIGTTAVQVAHVLDARVIATAGGPARVEAVRALGAQTVLDHRALGPAALTDAVLAATRGRGADVILDPLGGGALAENVRRLASGGRLILIGTQQGRRGELDVLGLMQRRAAIHAATLRGRGDREKAQIVREVTARLLPAVGNGTIRPIVHAVLPLADAARAHELLRAGTVLGKVVLVP